MKRKAKNPLFFPGILKAISQLQNSKGATEAKILDYIERLMLVINPSSTSQKLRNVPQQVKRALKHAAKLGLVTQKGGKYLLTIDQSSLLFKPKTNSAKPRASATAHKCRTLKAAGGSHNPDNACPHCKKGRRRRARARRNRRRRRHRAHSEADLDDVVVDSKESLESDTLTL